MTHATSFKFKNRSAVVSLAAKRKKQRLDMIKQYSRINFNALGIEPILPCQRGMLPLHHCAPRGLYHRSVLPVISNLVKVAGVEPASRSSKPRGLPLFPHQEFLLTPPPLRC